MHFSSMKVQNFLNLIKAHSIRQLWKILNFNTIELHESHSPIRCFFDKTTSYPSRGLIRIEITFILIDNS